MYRPLLTALILLAPVAARAGECTDLAVAMGQEMRRASSVSEVQSLQDSQMCSSEYSSSSASQRGDLEAKYGVLSGSGSASADQVTSYQREHCNSQFGSNRSHAVFSEAMVRASEVTAQVVSKCLDVGTFRLTKLEIAGKAVVASFFNGTPLTLDIKQAVINPDELASCKIEYMQRIIKVNEESKSISGNEPAIELQPNHSITLDCTRKSESDGSKNAYYPAGVIGLTTVAGLSTVSLLEYSKKPILDERDDILQAQIDQLRAQVSTQLKAVDDFEKKISDKVYGAHEYGGIFTVQDIGNSNAFGNPAYASQPRCADGFTTSQIGRFRTAEPGPAGVGINLFACQKP